MSIDELLPCPFCGEASNTHGGIDPCNCDGDWNIRCWRCDTYGPLRRTEADAVAAWNERAQAALNARAGDDSARLDWLDSTRSDEVGRESNGDPYLIARYWAVYGQCDDIRTAIDAALASQAVGVG